MNDMQRLNEFITIRDKAGANVDRRRMTDDEQHQVDVWRRQHPNCPVDYVETTIQ